MIDKLKEHFANMTDEEKAETVEFFRDKRPKGWVSIDDHLPMMYAKDLIDKGFSTFKVKDKDGNEFESNVSDHHIWEIDAKERGVTHWYNN
jgi:hypothetical protein